MRAILPVSPETKEQLEEALRSKNFLTYTELLVKEFHASHHYAHEFKIAEVAPELRQVYPQALQAAKQINEEMTAFNKALVVAKPATPAPELNPEQIDVIMSHTAPNHTLVVLGPDWVEKMDYLHELALAAQQQKTYFYQCYEETRAGRKVRREYFTDAEALAQRMTELFLWRDKDIEALANLNEATRPLPEASATPAVGREHD